MGYEKGTVGFQSYLFYIKMRIDRKEDFLNFLLFEANINILFKISFPKFHHFHFYRIHVIYSFIMEKIYIDMYNYYIKVWA